MSLPLIDDLPLAQLSPGSSAQALGRADKNSIRWRERTMSVEENKLVVREFIEETLNKGNVDAAGDYVADSVVELVPFPGQGPGLAGLKDVLRGMRIAFPDNALDDRGANC